MNNEERIIGMLEQVMQKVDGFQQETNGRLGKIEQDVSGLKQDVGGLKQDVGGLKQDVGGLKQDVGALRQEVRIVRTTQENTVIPQIKILAEGHGMLSDQIKSLSVIDAMRLDIDTLKAAVVGLSQKVAE